MNQEEPKENTDSNEKVTNSPEETSNPAEAAIDAAAQASSPEEIDNLPIESIGSYGRLEDLITDEEKEKTSNSTNQS